MFGIKSNSIIVGAVVMALFVWALVVVLLSGGNSTKTAMPGAAGVTPSVANVEKDQNEVARDIFQRLDCNYEQDLDDPNGAFLVESFMQEGALRFRNVNTGCGNYIQHLQVYAYAFHTDEEASRAFWGTDYFESCVPEMIVKTDHAYVFFDAHVNGAVNATALEEIQQRLHVTAVRGGCIDSASPSPTSP